MTGITNQSSAQGIFSNLAQALAQGNRRQQVPYMAPVAPVARAARSVGSPLDGSEVAKGPEETIKPESNSVTQPIGIDYNIFQGSADGATGADGVGGVGAGVGTGPGDAAAAANASVGGNDGTNGVWAKGGLIKSRYASGGSIYAPTASAAATAGSPEDTSNGAADMPYVSSAGPATQDYGGYELGPYRQFAVQVGRDVGALKAHGGPIHANQKMAAHLASQGRRGDTTLVHMTPEEVKALGRLHPTGQVPVNPKTGLPEANFFADILPGIAGTVLGTAVGMPWLGAVTAGLGTFATSGNLGKGILSGLMSFGLGSLGGMLGSAGEAAAGAATGAAGEAGKVASEAGVKSAMDLAAQGAPSAIDPVYGSVAKEGASALGNTANVPTGAYFPQKVPGLVDTLSQRLQNAPQTFANIGQGIVNPDQWSTSMIKPAILGATGAYGLNAMNQQPAAIPNPMAQQQQSQYSGTPSSVPYRTPTGGTVPAGYNPASYPRSAERDWFAPNPAYTGPQISYAEGGQIYSEGGGVFQDGGQYQLARGGVANLPSGLIRGPGAGMDDKVKGSIDGRRDVYLSDGEYVVDAQTISALGDGSTEAGAKRMKKIVEEIRQKKFGSKKQPKKMASMGGLASLPFDHLQAGSDGKPVKGGDYRGPGFLEKYFGIGRDEPQDPSRSWSMQTPKSEWPTQEEVDAARYYKQRYGNINEQEINPPAENEDVKYKQRGTKLNFMPEENLREFERTGKATGVKKKESKEFSDALYAAQLAANADPISYLGKDISRLNINDPPDDYTNAGYYSPKTDQIWWSGGKNQRTIPMHEYTHRGIAQLLNEHPNILEYDKNITVDGRNKHWDEEEYLVRRMILDRFGPIELRGGRKIEDHPDPAFRAAFKKDESADRHIQDMRRKAGELVARKLIDQQGAIR